MGETAVDRRAALALLLESTVLCCLARFGVRPAVATERERSAPAPSRRLSPSHVALAGIGAIVEAADHDAADRLAGFVAAEAERLGLDGDRIDDAARLCSVLLADARVRAEFREAPLEPVDGWMLARSEAAIGVYLHRLLRGLPPASDVH